MIEKFCPTCGTTFKVKPSHDNKRKYCSRPCMATAYKDRMKGAENPNYKDVGGRICLYCKSPYHSYDKQRLYCSDRCSNDARRKHPKKDPYTTRTFVRLCVVCLSKARRHSKYCEECSDKPFIYLYGYCKVCGEEIEVSAKRYPFKPYIPKYCSNKCRLSTLSGKGNPRYIDGRTPENKRIRASQEYKDWRRAVFERDSYTCQHCGQIGGKLHADHINPFSTCPKLRLNINNGRTLCVPCHQKTPTFLNGAKKRPVKDYVTLPAWKEFY